MNSYLIFVPSRGVEPLLEAPQATVLSIKLRGRKAEGVGFEPTVGVILQQFSRLPHSSTLAPLPENLRVNSFGDYHILS
jgi:hypothetical protein